MSRCKEPWPKHDILVKEECSANLPAIHISRPTRSESPTLYYGNDKKLKTKTDSNSQTLYGDRIDSLAQELEDTREKLRKYAEENTMLKNEVDALATKLYKSKALNHLSERTTNVSSTSSDITVTGSRSSVDTLDNFLKGNASNPRIANEVLDREKKLFEAEMTRVEQHIIGSYKSGCQTEAHDSASVRKSLNEIVKLHKSMFDKSKEYIAAMEIQTAEIHQLRKMMQEKETEITGFYRTVINLVEAERELLESERYKMDEEKSPNVDLKRQIIQLRCGLEAKITQLQNEVSLLKSQKAELNMKCADLEKLFPNASMLRQAGSSGVDDHQKAVGQQSSPRLERSSPLVYSTRKRYHSLDRRSQTLDKPQSTSVRQPARFLVSLANYQNSDDIMSLGATDDQYSSDTSQSSHLQLSLESQDDVTETDPVLENLKCFTQTGD